MKTTIRDYFNRIIGYIETDEQGNKVARDFYNRIIGKYDSKNDWTTDFYGKKLAKGDITTSLVWSSANKSK